MQEISALLQTELECPVCYQTPRSAPIFQCENGHLLCNVCKPRMNACPQGKCELTDQRSRLAENLLEKSDIPRPCHFAKDGCLTEQVLKSLEIHEKGCPFRRVWCPDLDCPDELMEKDVVNHLVEDHGTKKEEFEQKKTIDDCLWIVDVDDLQKRSINGTWPLSIWRHEDHVFFSMLLKERHEHLWHAWIYILGSKELSRKYTAKIAMKNKSETLEISYKGQVHPLDFEAIKIAHSGACLTVTDTTVERFMMACPDQDKIDSEEDDLKFLLRIQYSVISEQ